MTKGITKMERTTNITNMTNMTNDQSREKTDTPKQTKPPLLAAIINGIRTHDSIRSFLGRGPCSVQIMYWTHKPHQWQKWIQKETSLNVAYTKLFILKWDSNPWLHKEFSGPRPMFCTNNVLDTQTETSLNVVYTKLFILKWGSNSWLHKEFSGPRPMFCTNNVQKKTALNVVYTKLFILNSSVILSLLRTKVFSAAALNIPL